MDQARTAERPSVVDPRWIWLKTRGAIVLSMLSAFVAAVGFEVKPKELIRPVLMSAGFVELSVANEDTEALIKRIQDIADKKPNHALILELRRLAKETRSPFDAREEDIPLRLSESAESGPVAVVCKNSRWRDTYLQVTSREKSNLVILKVDDEGECTGDEVLVHPDTWALLPVDKRGGTAQTLKMHVLLHRPPNLI